MSNAFRYTALGLAGGATVLLILVQFLPIESESSSFAGFDFKFDANLWNMETEANGEKDTHGWFEECDGDEQGCDGLGLIRTGAIVLTAGLAAAAAAAILFAFGPGRAATIVAFGAAALSLAGFLFWTIGYAELLDDTAEATDAAAGFVLAIIATVLLVASGVVGLFVRGGPAPAPRRGRTVDF